MFLEAEFSISNLEFRLFTFFPSFKQSLIKSLILKQQLTSIALKITTEAAIIKACPASSPLIPAKILMAFVQNTIYNGITDNDE